MARTNIDGKVEFLLGQVNPIEVNWNWEEGIAALRKVTSRW